jgi:cytochrome P450
MPAANATPQPVTRARRPPLVPSVPIIGPLREFAGDSLRFLQKTRAVHGDAFRLRMLGIELTCLCGPEALDLLEEGSPLRTGQSMHVLDRELKSRLPSLFDGPQHKAFRRLHSQFLNRGLESGRREDIHHCLTQHVAHWSPGDRLDVLKEAQTQTVDVLSNILNGEPFPFGSKDLALVVHTLIGATYGHAPRWLVLNNPAYRLAIHRMRKHMRDLVSRVRADPALAARTLVGQYLDFPPPDGAAQWDDNDLVAVPMAAYLAGFDTVASAISFLMYQLLSHPDTLAAVREEYATLARDSDGLVDPMKQKLLRAAFIETVRLNPPGSLVIRFADRDFDFQGYTVRKGDEIMVMIASHHLNEALFPRHDEFDPGRFHGGSEDAVMLKRHVLPFGSGNHRCTGAMVGELMAVEIVSHWINHFDLALAPAGLTPTVIARPFTQPAGLRMTVLGRRQPLAGVVAATG